MDGVPRPPPFVLCFARSLARCVYRLLASYVIIHPERVTLVRLSLSEIVYPYRCPRSARSLLQLE